VIQECAEPLAVSVVARLARVRMLAAHSVRNLVTGGCQDIIRRGTAITAPSQPASVDNMFELLRVAAVNAVIGSFGATIALFLYYWWRS